MSPYERVLHTYICRNYEKPKGKFTGERHVSELGKKQKSWKGLLHLLLKSKICTFYRNYHKVFHLFVFSHVSVVTVRTGDNLLWTVSIKMFLQKSFLKFSSAVILAKDFSVLTIHIHMLLKPKHTKGWILPLNLLHWTSFFLLYRDEWRHFFYSALVLVEVSLLDGNSILSVALTSLQRLSLMFWSQTLVFITVKKNLVLWIWKFFLNRDRSREKSLSKINDNKVEEHSHCNR